MLFSQTLSSVLEKKKVALGEPNVYRIRVEGLKGREVVMAPKNELLPFHFEEIKDSVSIQGNFYERTVVFAVFEEGVFPIPSFDVKIGGQLYKTTPYEVEVVNTAQQGEAINDIMNNKTVKLDMQDYWAMYKWYLLGVLALVALFFLVWQVLRYGRYRRSSPMVATNQTLKQLEQLKKKNYIEKGAYRAFYVELIEISREFLSKQYRVPAEVLLTDDLIALMRDNQTISKENEAVIEAVFLRGDGVKFAKDIPSASVMREDFEAIRRLVKNSLKDLEFENLRTDV